MLPHCISTSKRAPPGSLSFMPLNQEPPVSAMTVVSTLTIGRSWRTISARISFASGAAGVSGGSSGRMRRYSTIVASRFSTLRASAERKSRRWIRPKSWPSSRTRSGSAVSTRIGNINATPAATISRYGRRHVGIEPRQPPQDLLARKRGVAQLSMLLGTLARGEDPRGYGLGADELAHRPVEPVNVKKMVLLTFRQQDVLLDVVKDAVKRVLRDGGKKIERRPGTRDVHPLRYAPVEHGARRALLCHECLSPLAVAGLEQRYQLLRLAGRHLFQRHIEARVCRGQRNDVLDPRLERGRPDSEIAAAGSAQPVGGVELEIVEHRLGRLLPGVLEVDASSQRSTLPGAIESDHRKTEIGQRQQKTIEFFDEGIVAAV